ncbi:DcaP family trimeric outer membrane transporter [Halomonas sp. SL1]|uniref:DcaP family trimeric outer membrane transporter n=1 Tax=Halomonas sp. SL1 TaxID=2137478 RepID=UPI000D15F5CA|nr:DcaP family trimeric outer membrane transporter [Halomonas sp. SL1]RAH36546.1 hypothetical protein C9J49_015280 [Halomonas sp. SL1]
MHKKLTSGLLAAISGLGICLPAQAMEQEDGFQVGNTTISMQGFVKLDAIATRTGSGEFAADELRDLYVPSTTPVGGDDSSESLNMHAKESRFSFRTKTDVGTGTPITGLLEMDFGPGREVLNGTATTNRSSVNLRHAFFQYGNWGFGQTWSTALFGPAMMETLNFFALSEGTPSQRTPQVRYENASWAIGLESPTTTAQLTGTDTSVASLKDDATDSLLPDVVARYSIMDPSYQLAFVGILRQLQVDGSVNNAFSAGPATVDDTELGYGLGAAGNIGLGDETDLKFMVLGGSGVGRYTGLAFTPDVEISDDGSSMNAVDHVGFNIGLAHRLNSQWRTNVGFGMEHADLSGEKLSDSSWSGTANLLYSPVRDLTLGAEIKHGERTLVNGESGSQSRLQFSAKYSFGL